MNHLQTNLTANLGALELNTAAAVLADGALEAAAFTDPGPRPTPAMPISPLCRRIDAQGIDAQGIDDGALEASSLSLGAPTKQAWTGPCCGRIDDAALEASRVSPHTTLPPRCHFIDDGVLEEAAGLQMGPQTFRRLPTTMCVA
jgi:hypothetical protein